MFPTLSLLQFDSFMCQQMIENMKSQWWCFQERTVCVHWDQISLSVCGSVPSLLHLSSRLLLHTLLSHWIRLESEIATKPILLFESNKQLCAPLYWLLYFPALWDTKQHQMKRKHKALPTHLLSFQTDTDVSWFSCMHHSFFSAVYNSETLLTLHWDVSCEGKGLPVPEDMPVISRDEVHLLDLSSIQK